LGKAARSVFLFGIYVVGLGLVLIVAPNTLLGLFGVAETHEVWIRVLGVLIFNIGVYYILAGRRDLRPIIVASVPIRFGTMTFLAIFVLLNQADATVILFGFVDVATAIWTLSAIRAEHRARV